MLLLIGAQPLFKQATPIEEAMDAACDLEDDELDILGRRLDGDKVRPMPRAASNEHAIGDEDVEVDVEVQRAAESLDRGDCSTSSAWQAALLREALEMAEDGSQHNREDSFAEVIVPGEPKPERDGQGEHPLANRNTGQDALPPPQRPLRHPSPSAPRAEATPLAGESDDAVETASSAGGPVEALREVATPHKLSQLSQDETRQRLAGFLAALRDRLQVLSQQRG